MSTLSSITNTPAIWFHVHLQFTGCHLLSRISGRLKCSHTMSQLFMAGEETRARHALINLIHTYTQSPALPGCQHTPAHQLSTDWNEPLPLSAKTNQHDTYTVLAAEVVARPSAVLGHQPHMEIC